MYSLMQIDGVFPGNHFTHCTSRLSFLFRPFLRWSHSSLSVIWSREYTKRERIQYTYSGNEIMSQYESYFLSDLQEKSHGETVIRKIRLRRQTLKLQKPLYTMHDGCTFTCHVYLRTQNNPVTLETAKVTSCSSRQGTAAYNPANLNSLPSSLYFLLSRAVKQKRMAVCTRELVELVYTMHFCELHTEERM